MLRDERYAFTDLVESHDYLYGEVQHLRWENEKLRRRNAELVRRIRPLIGFKPREQEAELMKHDRSGYKRQYMRDMRAARKAGMSTAAYRKRHKEQTELAQKALNRRMSRQFKEKMERAGEAISKRMRQLGAMPP